VLRCKGEPSNCASQCTTKMQERKLADKECNLCGRMRYLFEHCIGKECKLRRRCSSYSHWKFVLFFTLALIILHLGILRTEDADLFFAVEETCAVFSVYGGKKRYENEVTNSIIRLKTNNPDIRVFLISDNPSLKSQYIDYFVKVKSTSEHGTWFTRTQALQKITHRCVATIALDSHVTSCSQNLRTRMLELIAPEDFVIGTNLVHDLSVHWKASPLKYTQMKIKKFPHNCVVLLKRGYYTQKILKAWLEEIKNGFRDDQQALHRALLKTSIVHTRLPERFIAAFKSIDRNRFGFWPRFTYGIDPGPVDLLHSYHSKALSSEFGTDVCRLLNKNAEANVRMIYQESENSMYENIQNQSSCLSRVGKYESLICKELFHSAIF